MQRLTTSLQLHDMLHDEFLTYIPNDLQACAFMIGGNVNSRERLLMSSL
jgi:hypothetical protein